MTHMYGFIIQGFYSRCIAKQNTGCNYFCQACVKCNDICMCTYACVYLPTFRYVFIVNIDTVHKLVMLLLHSVLCRIKSKMSREL